MPAALFTKAFIPLLRIIIIMSHKKDLERGIERRQGFEAYKAVFDESTLRALHRLIAQGVITRLVGPIKIGKESNVFLAESLSGKKAIKIYRVSANFKKMYEYMAPDPRFSGMKRNKMSVIYAWAKKEYRNLLKAREAGLEVPTPYAVYKNVLVMEFIGDDEAAPQLNKSNFDDPEAFYETLISNIKTLFTEAKLVHADLSAFNVLDHNGKPVIIDMSHAVTLAYPNVMQMLKRDVTNICTYFKRIGLKIDVEEEWKKNFARK